jgi:uncharacterized DUF497 family protein
MELEWDERKRLLNIEKHRLDFEDADQIFGGRFLKLPGRQVGDEVRHRAVGRIGENVVTAIYTERGDAIRIISIRKAREDERRRLHQAIHD